VHTDQLRKNYEIEIRWTAFPLHPETPEEGRTLEELFVGKPIDIEKVLAQLKKVADALGLPLGEREKTYNSRLAQELAKWAESIGLPEKEARSVLESRDFKEAVDSDWLRSRSLGITGVPTFLVDDRAIVGFPPYELIEEFMKTCGVKKLSH
jgi:predicted DsbA family dithiol-disulfide isomerase